MTEKLLRHFLNLTTKLIDTSNQKKDMKAANSTFVIGRISCFSDSLVVAESFVLRIKFSGKNHAHHKSAKRCHPVEKKSLLRNKMTAIKVE